MGPSRLFYKNRSAHSLLSSQDAKERGRFQPSPAESPLHSPTFSRPSQYGDEEEEGEEEEEEEEGQQYSHPYRLEETRFYQPTGHPTRSQSQRSPGQINTNLPQPTINLVGPTHSTPSSAVDDSAPDSFYRQEPAPNLPQHKEAPKRRRFFGLGGSSKDSTSNPPSAKLGRSISVRRREQLPDTFPKQGHQSVHQDRPSAHVSPTEDFEEDDERDPNIHSATNPPLPDKEPLRSPGLSQSAPHPDYSYGGSNPSSSQGRQGSHESSWVRTSSNVHHHAQNDSAQQHTPSSYHPSPASATSTSSNHHFYQRSPSDTLHEHWQEQPPSRPSSQQSLEPPHSGQHARGYETYHARGSSSQTSSLSHYTQGSMGPPPHGQAPNRRTSEAQEQSREGNYQPYAQNTAAGNVLPSNAPSQYTSQLTPQGQTFRGNPQASQMQQNNHEQGRSTPPPSRSRDDLSNMDYAQLQAKQEELRALEEKYRKVKKYYFEKEAQVQQLQNTLAHQRLAQSRTSLDDNEYANRFSRLDGAINNLAFNIRREWRQVPPWLSPHVNRDATTSPTREMTAVGRAAISRWLVDELLDRYFHPALEPGLSTQLKMIEKNLRRFAPPTPSDEEKEGLLTKISNWRLSTLDGLQEVLGSSQATENRAALTDMLVEKLVATLGMLLKDPIPAGVDNGVTMIVELAVGIAANLPLESRDVFVEYVTPNQPISEHYMKVETGLPPLTNPGDGPVESGETASLTSKQTEETGSIDSRETGNSNGNNAAEDKDSVLTNQPAQAGAPGKKKGGMFGGFIGGGGSGGKKSSITSTSSSSIPQQGQGAGAGGGGGTERKEDRVRFSTFMAVEVRGRNVLVKAPVYLRD